MATAADPPPPTDPDAEALEATFEAFLATLSSGNADLVPSLWTAFEALFLAHVAHEESTVIPELAAIRVREAHAILHEHRHLRSRLKEIGDSVARGAVRPESARSFLDELRAHARHEEAILSQWSTLKRERDS